MEEEDTKRNKGINYKRVRTRDEQIILKKRARKERNKETLWGDFEIKWWKFWVEIEWEIERREGEIVLRKERHFRRRKETNREKILRIVALLRVK